MEIVRPDEPKKRRGRAKVNRLAVMQSRIGLAMRQVFTPSELRQLFNDLDKRDKKDILIAFCKPAPLKPRDDLDALSSQQVDELYHKIMNNAK